MRRIDLADAAATEALGAQLSQGIQRLGRGVLYLHGDLGAGKSTLARGLLRAAGVRGTLRSPTYTLIEIYPVGPTTYLHLDLYRLAGADEIEQLGLRDYPDESTVWIIEWPERGGPGTLPAADLQLRLAHAGLARAAVLEPASALGQAIIDLK